MVPGLLFSISRNELKCAHSITLWASAAASGRSVCELGVGLGAASDAADALHDAVDLPWGEGTRHDGQN